VLSGARAGGSRREDGRANRAPRRIGGTAGLTAIDWPLPRRCYGRWPVYGSVEINWLCARVPAGLRCRVAGAARSAGICRRRRCESSYRTYLAFLGLLVCLTDDGPWRRATCTVPADVYWHVLRPSSREVQLLLHWWVAGGGSVRALSTVRRNRAHDWSIEWCCHVYYVDVHDEHGRTYDLVWHICVLALCDPAV